jgi:hypothetical protein
VVVGGGQVRLADDGIQRGLATGATTWFQGEQRGLTIAVFNYARELQGVQLGLINVAGNKRGLGRVLPIVNWHRD